MGSVTGSGSMILENAMQFGRCLLPSVLAGLLLLAPTSVFAYLDPGSGSMLLQMLIGGIVAALYTLKLYWRQMKGLFSRLVDGKTSNPADDIDECPSKREG